MSVTPHLFERKEDLSLRQAAEYLLDECRMVLPGIQALFGFQLIAVFNERFSLDLSGGEQVLHLAAIGLIAVAIALIMTPAAYHRQAGAQAVSDTFIRLSTRLLLWSMLPLQAGIGIDFYLIGRLILDSTLAAWLAAALFCVFTALWFVLPRVHWLLRVVAGCR